MATRRVTVVLEARADQLVAGMKKAADAAKGSADKVKSAWDKTSQSILENAQHYDLVGSSLMKLGAVGAAALVGMGKAAVDWESDFAGVRKTTDATEAEFAELEGQLREMARTLPAAHSEIAAVAEAAGQLGVAREDIASFSRTMIDLGETTNLSADEAATTLARFANVMGTSHSEMENLGSALVGLGNNFATTEAEIMQMSMRLSGAGAQVGMSEGDVLGLAAAMSSVGIEAEAGGTAMSMSMKKIQNAVMDGGTDLEAFARVAGMSAKQFAEAWQADPAQALTSFITGLAEVQAQGGNTNAILEELGITGIRESDAMLRLASAAGVLGDAFAQGNEEFEKGTALSDEAAQRYATAAAKIQVAWNNIKDAAIEMGGVLMPIIGSAAETVTSLAQAFGDLDPTTQSALVGVTGVVAAIALLGGAGLKAVVGLVEAKAAIDAISASAPRAAAALGIIGGAALGIGATVLALHGLVLVSSKLLPQTGGLEDYAAALEDLASGGASIDQAFQKTNAAADWLRDFEDATEPLNRSVARVDDLDSAMRRLFDRSWEEKTNDWFSKVLGGNLGFDTTISLIEDELNAMDDALAEMARSGHADQAAAAYQRLQESMKANAASAEEAAGYFDEYEKAVAELAEAGWAAAQDAGTTALDAITDSANQYADSMDAATDSNWEFMDSMLALSNAEIAFEESIDRANEAIKENGKNLDLNTASGRANQSALNAQAAASRDYIEQLVETDASAQDVQLAVDRATEAYITNATAAGYTAEEARQQAQAYFGLDSASNIAKGGVDGLSAALNAVPPSVRTQIAVEGWQAAVSAAESVANAIFGIPTSRTTYISQVVSNAGVGALTFAEGGTIPGWSPHPKADNIPVMATAGEFMQSVAAVDYYGTDFMHALNNRRIPREALGLADGGSVSRSPQIPAHVFAGQEAGGQPIIVNVPKDQTLVRVELVDERVRGLVRAEVRQMSREGAL